MLGVFSSQTVADSIELPNPPRIGQYHVRESGAFDEIDVTPADEELVATRQWEARSDMELAILPNPDEVERTLEWIVTKGGECGPHTLVHWYQSGRMVEAAYWYRGAVCIGDPVLCDGEPCHGGAFVELVWCEDPPPPCE